MLSAYGKATGTGETGLILAQNTSSKFDLGRKFANKVWNATRFALRILEDFPGDADPAMPLDGLSLVDRWIISCLHRTTHVVELLAEALRR